MSEKTNMKPDWVAKVQADNPPVRLPNGNIRSGPVRLGFANVIEPGKKKDGSEGNYGVVILFPEGADMTPYKDAVVELIKEKAPAALTNQALASKLHKPIKDQATFVNTKDPNGSLYDGFVAGRAAISANSASKPPCVDQKLAPIVDKREVYSGCWALVTVVPKWFDVDGNKGPTFYLQSVMKIADDENIGGVGAANPNTDFAGVKVDPAVNPSALFGAEGHTAGGGDAAAVDLFS